MGEATLDRNKTLFCIQLLSSVFTFEMSYYIKYTYNVLYYIDMIFCTISMIFYNFYRPSYDCKRVWVD